MHAYSWDLRDSAKLDFFLWKISIGYEIFNRSRLIWKCSSTSRSLWSERNSFMKGSKSKLKLTECMHTHTHLPVENDAPDEPENQFVISINDVCRSDIHQFDLEKGNGRHTDSDCYNSNGNSWFPGYRWIRVNCRLTWTLIEMICWVCPHAGVSFTGSGLNPVWV